MTSRDHSASSSTRVIRCPRSLTRCGNCDKRWNKPLLKRIPSLLSTWRSSYFVTRVQCAGLVRWGRYLHWRSLRLISCDWLISPFPIIRFDGPWTLCAPWSLYQRPWFRVEPMASTTGNLASLVYYQSGWLNWNCFQRISEHLSIFFEAGNIFISLKSIFIWIIRPSTWPVSSSARLQSGWYFAIATLKWRDSSSGDSFGSRNDQLIWDRE